MSSRLRVAVLLNVHEVLSDLVHTPEMFGPEPTQAQTFQEASDFFTFVQLKIKDAAGPYAKGRRDYNLSTDHQKIYGQCERWVKMLHGLYSSETEAMQA